MSEIRYIIFSDLHLGAENSILTHLDPDSTETDNTEASDVLIKMAQCLREVVSKNSGTVKPKLVLNGDIIELALTTTNNAAMAFQRFVENLFPAGEEILFDREIFYMSGNHDHPLWERSRNHYYFKYLESLKAGEYIKDNSHTTNLFNPEKIEVPLLNILLHRYEHLKDYNIYAAYPGHAVLSEDKEHCILISHGHYVESMYSLMTSLRLKIFPDRQTPQNLEELESENFGWIDFFWSTLGRSGGVGKDINLIYDKLQDPKEVEILIENMSQTFTSGTKNTVKHWIEKKILHAILELTLGKLASNERNEPEVQLTPEATEGLKTFLEFYILNHIKEELGGNVPGQVTFIFGHTHKPFQRYMDLKGYRNRVKVYNSGGWVVDTWNEQPLHGGSIILVDDNFETVALQMYREGKTEVTVEDANQPAEEPGAFYNQIESAIHMDREPWSGFSKAVSFEVQRRRKNLALIAESNN
ncbi:MAG: hypothetical protein JNL57_05040 [Bacteroidetes bacterium]|nr:hypothetical protein [Bacteroidota bacterium]